ncbi:NAD-P-binding protein [Lactifluus volemus]|nr:NAD-P-binding protein [Lactifluus volemus]
MSGYKNFAVLGAGNTGSFIIHQLLEHKSAGTINNVVVLTRQESKTTVEGDAKVIPVDYSNKQSVKDALAGVDVVICTIATAALGAQAGIAQAAKEAGVKLFVPSEFGGLTARATEGVVGQKAWVHDHLKALSLPYALFYTGIYSDFVWPPFLNIASGKVSVGGDGNSLVPFTSRTDIARYVCYVLTHLPADQLENRAFKLFGDIKSFNEVFKAYEAKSGKKVEVTYIPISELDARIAANPMDLVSYLHKLWATVDPIQALDNDNYLYPDWNPSQMIDNITIA